MKNNLDKELQDEKIKYKCESCEKTYEAEHNLQHHVKKHHLKIRNCICRICKEEFYLPCHLERHAREKHKPKPECDICGMKLSTVETVERHKQMVHFNIRNFKCEFCGFKFCSQWQMNVHIREVHNSKGTNPEREIRNAKNRLRR